MNPWNPLVLLKPHDQPGVTQMSLGFSDQLTILGASSPMGFPCRLVTVIQCKQLTPWLPPGWLLGSVLRFQILKLFPGPRCAKMCQVKLAAGHSNLEIFKETQLETQLETRDLDGFGCWLLVSRSSTSIVLPCSTHTSVEARSREVHEMMPCCASD